MKKHSHARLFSILIVILVALPAVAVMITSKSREEVVAAEETQDDPQTEDIADEAPVDEAPTTESPKEENPSVENPSENPSEVVTSEGSSEPTSEGGEGEKKSFLDLFEQYRLFVIIGAVVLLLLLIAIVILIVVITTIVKKKKSKKAAKTKGGKNQAPAPAENVNAGYTAPDAIGATVAAGAGPVGFEPTVAPITPTGEPGTVFMRIEVYSGHCMNTSDTFSLSNALVIGSSAQCDVIFADTDVSPVNTKIRLIDGQVYIEDQGTVQGTYLEGMRIPGRNRLRSGDIISIGSVEFAFKF